MSTQTTTQANDQVQDAYIPSEDDVQASGGKGAWRFAGGKIVRGSERQGTLEEKDPQKIVGALMRVGIHSGARDDGTTYSQLEADIQTAQGLIYTKSSLTDDEGRLKPSIATIGFAWGLTQIAKGEVLMITTAQGEPTPKGGKPTYVNFWRVKDGKATQIFRPKRDPNAPRTDLIEQWHELEPQIKKHAAFADRPEREDDEGAANAVTHLHLLNEACTQRGWPSPEQAPGEWLGMMAQAYNHQVRGSLASYSDEDWGQVRNLLQGALDENKMPGALKPALDRLKGAPAPAPQAAGAVNASAFGETRYDPSNDH